MLIKIILYPLMEIQRRLLSLCDKTIGKLVIKKNLRIKNSTSYSTLNEMHEALKGARKEILPSKYWIVLNKRHINQLKESGYENFKRTLAFSYFTWLASKKFWDDDQLIFLYSNLPMSSTIKNYLRTFKAIFSRKDDKLPFFQSLRYNFLTYMLWEFVSKNDKDHILDKLDEPLEGNPLKLYLNKRLISQDLANSVLEYKSISSGIKKSDIRSILELGAGYGRTAYVFLKKLLNLKYIVVDIPPALFIAEKYLSNQFKEKKIFNFRIFKDFNDIKEEFENSDIAFFLPNQLDLLPPNISDLFINISSLHEMRPDQIDYYFQCIDRLITKYVYIKQWKVSKIPYENTYITEKDYPIRKNWKIVFWRESLVKTKFFEALFEIKSN